MLGGSLDERFRRRAGRSRPRLAEAIPHGALRHYTRTQLAAANDAPATVLA